MEERERLAKIILEEQLRRVSNTLRRDYKFTEREFTKLLSLTVAERLRTHELLEKIRTQDTDEPIGHA